MLDCIWIMRSMSLQSNDVKSVFFGVFRRQANMNISQDYGWPIRGRGLSCVTQIGLDCHMRCCCNQAAFGWWWADEVFNDGEHHLCCWIHIFQSPWPSLCSTWVFFKSTSAPAPPLSLPCLHFVLTLFHFLSYFQRSPFNWNLICHLDKELDKTFLHLW